MTLEEYRLDYPPTGNLRESLEKDALRIAKSDWSSQEGAIIRMLLHDLTNYAGGSPESMEEKYRHAYVNIRSSLMMRGYTVTQEDQYFNRFKLFFGDDTFLSLIFWETKNRNYRIEYATKNVDNLFDREVNYILSQYESKRRAL